MELEQALRAIFAHAGDARLVAPDVKRSVLHEIGEIQRQFSSAPQDRISKADMRRVWMLAINKARFTPMIDSVMGSEKAFRIVDEWIWFDESSRLGVKKFEELEPDEFFSYLAERSWKRHERKNPQGVIEFYFDVRTLHEQARRPLYKRSKVTIRHFWTRILNYPFKMEFFREFQGMSQLRESVRGFLRN